MAPSADELEHGIGRKIRNHDILINKHTQCFYEVVDPQTKTTDGHPGVKVRQTTPMGPVERLQIIARSHDTWSAVILAENRPQPVTAKTLWNSLWYRK